MKSGITTCAEAQLALSGREAGTFVPVDTGPVLLSRNVDDLSCDPHLRVACRFHQSRDEVAYCSDRPVGNAGKSPRRDASTVVSMGNLTAAARYV